MFLRMLMWVVLGVIVWRFFFKPRPRVGPGTRPGAAPGAGRPPGGPATPAIAKAEPMVDCAHCGVHLPASEAVRDGASTAYCSVEHRAAGPRRAA